jgi:hypothetical protein
LPDSRESMVRTSTCFAATNRGAAAIYIPLQDAYGGPNYFNLDPKAVYAIQIDNDGDADLRFEFSFVNTYKDLAVESGGQKIPVPLINIGPIDAKGTNLNVIQSYSVTLARAGRHELLGNASLGGSKFYKPADNIGHKSIADYAAYAANFIYEVSIPDCGLAGRVFVGQRKDGPERSPCVGRRFGRLPQWPAPL